MLAALALAFVAVLFASAFWALTRANFIGVDEDGNVAVYQGVPWDLGGGVHLYRAKYVSQLQAVQLTPSERATLLDHKLISYDSARDRLATYDPGLEQRQEAELNRRRIAPGVGHQARLADPFPVDFGQAVGCLGDQIGAGVRHAVPLLPRRHIPDAEVGGQVEI